MSGFKGVQFGTRIRVFVMDPDSYDIIQTYMATFVHFSDSLFNGNIRILVGNDIKDVPLANETDFGIDPEDPTKVPFLNEYQVIM